MALNDDHVAKRGMLYDEYTFRDVSGRESTLAPVAQRTPVNPPKSGPGGWYRYDSSVERARPMECRTGRDTWTWGRRVTLVDPTPHTFYGCRTEVEGFKAKLIRPHLGLYNS